MPASALPPSCTLPSRGIGQAALQGRAPAAHASVRGPPATATGSPHPHLDEEPPSHESLHAGWALRDFSRLPSSFGPAAHGAAQGLEHQGTRHQVEQDQGQPVLVVWSLRPAL